jgi:hypothetical protein
LEGNFAANQANLSLLQLSATAMPAVLTTAPSRLMTLHAPLVPTVVVVVEDKAVEDAVAHAVMTATLAQS